MEKPFDKLNFTQYSHKFAKKKEERKGEKTTHSTYFLREGYEGKSV